MQYSIQIASTSLPRSQLSWKPQKAHLFSHSWSSMPFVLKTSLEPFAVSDSLKTTFNFESDGKELQGLGLPVAIRKPESVSRFVWDGDNLKLVCVDGKVCALSPLCFDFENGFRRMVRVISASVKDFLLPREVKKNHLQYVKWKFLHRVFSSALQALAGQAMLRTILIGYTPSLPSDAFLTWLLKDGLGRIIRCFYTANRASVFDTNLKRERFSTAVQFSLSIGVELLLTPAFPKYFWPLATLAIIIKQKSLACYLATNAAIHRSFAIADNLGEVSAKAQIQTVCFDSLGLMLAAVLNIFLKNNQRLQAGLPFVVYPIFSALDLFGTYQGLKHVHLQTLTKNRLEIIINTWIYLGHAPSPAEVSKKEDIFFWRKAFGPDREHWPITIGSLNLETLMPKKLSVMTMRSLKAEDFCIICMETFNDFVIRDGRQGIILCLREGAATAEVITSLLQACYVRRELLCNESRWKNILETCDISDAAVTDWLKLIEDSKKSAAADFQRLNEEMSRLGWANKNILLSKEEQARFFFLDDSGYCSSKQLETLLH